MTGCQFVDPSVRRDVVARHVGLISGDRYDVVLRAAHGNGHDGIGVVATYGWHVVGDLEVNDYERGVDDGCHDVWHAYLGEYAKSHLPPVLFSRGADQLQPLNCATSAQIPSKICQ